MKKLILAFVFFSVINCKSIQAKSNAGNSPLSQKYNDTATIVGHWQLLPVLASDTSAGKTPQLNFDVKTNKFSGNTGCNAISGSFILKNDALSFGENMVSTKMACPGYNEPAFMKSLKSATHYRLRNGVLTLLSDDKTELSHWMRKPSAPSKTLKA